MSDNGPSAARGHHRGRASQSDPSPHSDRWWDHELYAGLCNPDQPLRITHLCKYFPPERGGMETYVHDLALQQAAAGHHVHVLAHTESASAQAHTIKGCRVVRCRVALRLGEYVPFAPRLPWELWKALRTASPHIVHLHCPNPAALWCLPFGAQTKAAPADALTPAPATDAARAAPRASDGASRPRLVVHWHSDVIFPPDRQPHALALRAWRCMERALLHRADRIIATSRPYLDTSEFLAPWRSKCVVAPLRLSGTVPVIPGDVRHPAVDFLQRDSNGSTRAVLAVGRLAHYKGFDVLVRAVAAAPTLRCCIVGEGEERAALRRLIAEQGVQDRVLLAGEVDDAVLTACYAACHVFCLPSILRTEAFGVVLLEALRAGKWCVASDVCGSGMGTVIQHGHNGWLVEPGNVSALAAALTANAPACHAGAAYSPAGE